MLDNAIWSALTTRQTHLAERRGRAVRFLPDVNMLGAVEDPTGFADLAQLMAVGDQVGLFIAAPPSESSLAVMMDLPLVQMIHEGEAVDDVTDIVELGVADVPDMLALTELTKPGPFRTRTCESGDYFGVRVDGQLVAMVGERLRMPGHTEVSAICTHPEFLGRGLAARLTSHVVARIYARGEQPLLHSRADNDRAIALYERLGFRLRLANRYVLVERR